MAMRGILVALACALLAWGCSCNKRKLLGRTDAGFEPAPDPALEPSVDTPSDPVQDPDPEIIEDMIIDAWPDVHELCGNGILDEGEECDDGDRDDCNGCSATCRWERAMQVSGLSRGAFAEEAGYPCLPCSYTIELWFRIDEPSSGMQLFDLPGFAGFSAGINEGTGIFTFEINNVYGTFGGWSEEPIEPNTWHHYAASCWPSWRDDEMGHFIDGRLMLDLYPWVARMPTCTGRMVLVGSPDAYPDLHHVAVTIDEMRISNEGIYRDDTPFVPERRLSIRPDTVALWDFNQTVDGIIPDISGNGHDAVLVDGTLVPDDCHLP